MATSAAPQPTPDEAADIASADEERSIALGNLSAAEGQLASDRADFDPTGIEGTQGPQPTFNEPTPQDHMQDIMKVAPLWMALGAIGGKFFKQSGLTMLSSTNAMMKGLVQGNADAYGQAREKYEQDYANFRDKQKTWMDVYRAYLTAYKGRIDADLRAVAGANTAVGIADKDLRAAHADVFKADQVAQQADRLTAQMLHWQNQDAQNAIRTEALRHKVAQEAGVAPDSQEAELLAALSEKGVSLPQGLRNKEVLKSTLSALIAKHPDETMDQIAAGIKSGQIDMRTTQAEASKLGQREAAILPTEKSIVRPGGFLDQAEKAIQDVDLLKLKKAGSIEQWGREQLSDPKMAAYKARVTELRQEYAIVLAKSGQTTDKARDEAKGVVPDIITPGEFAEIRKAVTQGIETAKKSVRESIDETEGKPTPPPAPPAQTPPKYAYGPDGKPQYQLINGNWVPIAH